MDPFRPNVQLKTFLHSLASHPNLTPGAVQAAQGLLHNSSQKKVRTLACKPPLSIRTDLDGVKKYPLSNKTLQPASMPKHYERLMQGYEKSAQGTGRPWWQVFFGIWR